MRGIRFGEIPGTDAFLFGLKIYIAFSICYNFRKQMARNRENSEVFMEAGREGFREEIMGEVREKDAIKTVAESRTEQGYMIRARYLNSVGRLFGGDLLAWIDETGAFAAKRHCNREVTTVAIDNIHFAKAMFEGDIAVLIAKVTYVGNTSMEVRVHTYVEELDGKRTLVNSAYLVYVAIEEDRPIRVPRLKVCTQEQKDEWIAGEKRALMRQQRRKEGY